MRPERSVPPVSESDEVRAGPAAEGSAARTFADVPVLPAPQLMPIIGTPPRILVSHAYPSCAFINPTWDSRLATTVLPLGKVLEASALPL